MGQWISNQIHKFAESFIPISETVALAGCIYVPINFDLKGLFARYLQESIPDPDNFIKLFLFSMGNIFIGVTLFITLLLKIREHNAECLFNRGHAYHDYPYWWYWYCASILGYKKCNLIHTPIYTQFRLILRNTFDEYPLSESDFPPEDENNVEESWIYSEQEQHEYNLILEDTYPVDEEKVLSIRPNVTILKISRSVSFDLSRHYNVNFIRQIIHQVRKMPDGVTINIFATTNPKNTLEIARGAFQMAGRGNISHLYVFQQTGTGQRTFEKKGHKIF